MESGVSVGRDAGLKGSTMRRSYLVALVASFAVALSALAAAAPEVVIEKDIVMGVRGMLT